MKFILCNHYRKSLDLTIVASLLVALASCMSVPMTDRRQLIVIPNSQIMALSDQEYRKILTDSKLSNNQEAVDSISRVGRRIASAVTEFYNENDMVNDFDWEFNLIEDDETVNAFCMPGGKIAFYTGILKYTRDEAGIATVMGHEVAHAVARHGNERFSQSLLTELGTALVSKALADKPEQTQMIFRAAIGVGTHLGITLPFSRMQETEADRIGLILMAKAGYDPRQAVPFWERMSAASKSKLPELLSTHPSDEHRIRDLQRQLNDALKHYQPQS